MAIAASISVTALMRPTMAGTAQTASPASTAPHFREPLHSYRPSLVQRLCHPATSHPLFVHRRRAGSTNDSGRSIPDPRFFFGGMAAGELLAPEARMRVAGGKPGETRRTHRIAWKCSRAPAGRMKCRRRLASCALPGRETFWWTVRWVRPSMWLPTGYLHWPRQGRTWAASVFHSTGHNEDPHPFNRTTPGTRPALTPACPGTRHPCLRR